MKEFILKYKVGFIITILVFVLLLAFTIVRYEMATNSAEAAVAAELTTIPEEEINDAGWQVPEIQQKKKEVNWLERQLSLAKSDSINMSINFADSTIQVQLKGTVLFQAKIQKQNPAQFFDNLNYGTYLDFTRISRIVDEQATIVKRPVKKIQAPKNEDEAAKIKHDTIPDPLIVWQFKLDNQINIVITGIGLNKDSVPDLQYNNDILKYSIAKLKDNPFPKNYIPTLYIWLNDKDAKAIYRALPEKGKVTFRN